MNWIVLVLISAVLLAAANIIRKLVLSHEHSLEFLAARSFFIIPVLLFFIPFVERGLDLRMLCIIYLASLIATLGYYSQTKAQRHTDISYLSPMQNLSPLVLLILAYLFLGESVSPINFLGIVATVIGGYLLALEPGMTIIESLRSVRKSYWLHLTLSIVLLALSAALAKYILHDVQSVTYLFFAGIFMSINYLLLDWWLYDWRYIKTDFAKGWQWLLLAAAFTVLGTLVFYETLAIPAVLVSVAYPLSRLSALLEVFFGGRLFHEKNMPRRLFACLIILVGAAFLVL